MFNPEPKRPAYFIGNEILQPGSYEYLIYDNTTPAAYGMDILQCSPLNPNTWEACQIFSNYEFALNISCIYNGLSRDHHYLSELTEPELRGLQCIKFKTQVNYALKF